MMGEKIIDQAKEAIGAPVNGQNQENINYPRQEKNLEQPLQNVDTGLPGEGKATMEKAGGPKVANATAPLPMPDPQLAIRQKAIEGILADNMIEAFQGLTAEQKMQFKTVGEKTAQQINVLLSQTKVQVNKIINLIKSWLNILPGINKFFLEKEAKIKADAVIQLKKGGEQ